MVVSKLLSSIMFCTLCLMQMGIPAPGSPLDVSRFTRVNLGKTHGSQSTHLTSEYRRACQLDRPSQRRFIKGHDYTIRGTHWAWQLKSRKNFVCNRRSRTYQTPRRSLLVALPLIVMGLLAEKLWG